MNTTFEHEVSSFLSYPDSEPVIRKRAPLDDDSRNNLDERPRHFLPLSSDEEKLGGETKKRDCEVEIKRYDTTGFREGNFCSSSRILDQLAAATLTSSTWRFIKLRRGPRASDGAGRLQKKAKFRSPFLPPPLTLLSFFYLFSLAREISREARPRN